MKLVLLDKIMKNLNILVMWHELFQYIGLNDHDGNLQLNVIGLVMHITTHEMI